jgi:hypothetical protein
MSETKRTRQHRYWLLRPDASTPCADCGVNTCWLGESYMVCNNVWNQAWVGYAPQTRTERRFLCVGCFEARIGRRLAAKDFRPVLVNDPNDPQMTLRGGSTSARPHALVYRCPLQQ